MAFRPELICLKENLDRQNWFYLKKNRPIPLITAGIVFKAVKLRHFDLIASNKLWFMT